MDRLKICALVADPPRIRELDFDVAEDLPSSARCPECGHVARYTDERYRVRTARPLDAGDQVRALVVAFEDFDFEPVARRARENGVLRAVEEDVAPELQRVDGERGSYARCYSHGVLPCHLCARHVGCVQRQGALDELVAAERHVIRAPDVHLVGSWGGLSREAQFAPPQRPARVHHIGRKTSIADFECSLSEHPRDRAVDGAPGPKHREYPSDWLRSAWAE